MARYRKKPVVVEAVQWFQNGDHPDVEAYKIEGANEYPACKHCGVSLAGHGWIDTLESGHVACPGDWIIIGIQGERYPCKPGVFAATYEAVNQVERGVTWTEDTDGEYWSCSGCDCAWILNVGTPSENGMHYCPRCGQRIVGERATVEEVCPEEESDNPQGALQC